MIEAFSVLDRNADAITESLDIRLVTGSADIDRLPDEARKASLRKLFDAYVDVMVVGDADPLNDAISELNAVAPDLMRSTDSLQIPLALAAVVREAVLEHSGRSAKDDAADQFDEMMALVAKANRVTLCSFVNALQDALDKTPVA